MLMRAKVFQNGGSQAVRLPKSCRFGDDQGEVIVRREGKRVILEPADEWPQEFLDCLGGWKEEIQRPPSQSIGTRKVPLARP
jgi:antitoxin VapB